MVLEVTLSTAWGPLAGARAMGGFRHLGRIPPPPPLASNPLVEDAPKFRRGSAQHHVTGRVPDRYVLIT